MQSLARGSFFVLCRRHNVISVGLMREAAARRGFPITVGLN